MECFFKKLNKYWERFCDYILRSFYVLILAITPLRCSAPVHSNIPLLKTIYKFLRLSHDSCWKDREVSTATCKSSSGVDCEKRLLYTLSRSVVSTVIGWSSGSLIGWPTRSVIGSFSVFPYGVHPSVRYFDPAIPVDAVRT